MAAGSFACREGSRHVVRLPLPQTEELASDSETRPGSWLSSGDAVEWDLPSGPSRRVGGTYSASLAGVPAGRLDLSLDSAEPGDSSRTLWRSKVNLAADPSRWRSWSRDLPRLAEPTRLRIAYRGPVPNSLTRSLFLTEPFLSVSRRERPRTIVLFLIDTLRADRVSGYGYTLPTTPRLDRFFRDGLRAETCLPPANWTLPSHASLFTSLSVARHGVGRYGHHLPENLPTLAGTLARAGYRTLAVTGGGYVDAAFGLARGFDRYAVVGGSASYSAGKALSMLEEHAGEPVFLFFHTYQVHDYVPDEAAARRLFPDLSALGPDWRENVAALLRTYSSDPRLPAWYRARYDAALRSVDDGFGRLIEGLEKSGRLERTAVLMTSDHGESLCDRALGRECLSWGHASPYLFEEELRVPLQVRVPWLPGARGTITTSTTLLDVAPTLLAAAGVRSPAAFEGRSLLSGSPRTDRVVATEAPPLDALALRQGSRKIIQRTGAPQDSWLDGSPFQRLPAEECFDLARDPAERSPIPCESEESAGLRDRLDRYIASSLPDSLVLRLPPRAPGSKPRTASIRARGRSAPPAVRTFGLGSPPALGQRGTVTEVRFSAGPAPVWLAFEPADGSRAMEMEFTGIGRPTTAKGVHARAGAYRWQELAWSSGRPLPAGPALFTTPSSGGLSSSSPPLPTEVVGRLLSLGYLRGVPPVAQRSAPAQPAGSERQAVLAPGEVRIRRVE